MKTILFFNNKGGVGKTTLACNLVSYLNINMNKRVLLIDADPQCNSTQMMLSDDVLEKIYFQNSSDYHTIYTALSSLEDGEPSICKNINPILGTSNNFQTDIIPGHPKLSVIEDILSDAWGGVRARDVGGIRVTNWCKNLTELFKDRYDYIVFDVGPSLGALNRSIVLNSDFIVTPFGCDIFSLLGIKNISSWIEKWREVYQKSIDEMLDDKRDVFERNNVIIDTSEKFRFGGFSIQQYIKRKFKTGERPVAAYEEVMKQIPGTVETSMNTFFNTNLNINDYELGHIPYVNSLVPLSQTSKTPIHALTSSSGLVGPQGKQKAAYSELMEEICNRLINIVEHQ
ncbi:ParA family protein [Vibrio alginolyticus]|nr:ParA family protein [Vibrio alginolyticus]